MLQMTSRRWRGGGVKPLSLCATLDRRARGAYYARGRRRHAARVAREFADHVFNQDLAEHNAALTADAWQSDQLGEGIPCGICGGPILGVLCRNRASQSPASALPRGPSPRCQLRRQRRRDPEGSTGEACGVIHGGLQVRAHTALQADLAAPVPPPAVQP